MSDTNIAPRARTRRVPDPGRPGQEAGQGVPPPHPPRAYAPGDLRGRYVGDRYRLDELIGTGGTAQVWRATMDSPDLPETPDSSDPARQVAVKLLHPHLVPDGTARIRLIAEARAVRALHHPGIVQLRDVVLNDSELALVFDYVPGGSLRAMLQNGALEPREAAEIAAQVAETLEYAHERGVVHLDVTPGNVLIGSDGRPRLTDFGIARLLEEAAVTATMTGSVTGTLRYIAPEQLAARDVDGRADVYSLGVVLYEMLAGHPPFDARNPVALAAQQAAPMPPLPEGVPEPLRAAVEAATQLRPVDRPQSAGDLATYLREWLDGRSPNPSLLSSASRSRVEKAGPAGVATAAARIALGTAASRPYGIARGSAGTTERRRSSPRDRRSALTWPRTLVGAAAIFLAGIVVAAALLGASPQGVLSPTQAPSAHRTPNPTATAVRPTATPSPIPRALPAPPARPPHGHKKHPRGRRPRRA